MDVFDTAKWSPSYKNTQPWEAVIVSGAKKDELSKLLVDIFKRGEKPKPDIPEPESWPSHIDMRIQELFRKRSEKFGIDFSEPAYIKKAKIANFRFYGAPHGIFLFQDASLPLWSLFDMGLFAHGLMLAAHAYGLGTVPQAFLTDYSHEVKKFLGIPESKRLVLGISIGYPDLKDMANSYRTDRVDVNEIVKWVE
jgi:nitroreductase